MAPNSPSLLVPPTVLSVAGLTQYIQSLLEQDDELLQIWVTGEVSSLSRHASGLFLTLQDPDAQACLHCVIWNSYLERLAVMPTPGEQVILLGRLRLYPQRGQYQLMVWQCLPAGEGLRALRYRQLRQRLAAEGLFDPERKRSLPPHPQTIAVVSSPQAAAWGDIQRTLKNRYPGLRVLFSPARVQGDQAPAAIVHAIQRVERDGRAEVLILARGGGATEDMACFNDERVVRAIAECSIPVISGIGHQRDESLADLVADVYAHTPTAAAVQAVPRLADVVAEHQERIAALALSLGKTLQAAKTDLHQQRVRLRRLHLERLVAHEAEATACRRKLLIQAIRQRLQQSTQHCQLLQQELKGLDPKAVLKRGYAVVRQRDGTVVRSSATLTPGETLSLQLGEGQVQVQVIDAAGSPPLFQKQP